MGSGQKIFDYFQAAELLLRRSYPEIANGDQDGPIFIPETFLPSYTRAVDPDKFREKLFQCCESGLWEKLKNLFSSLLPCHMPTK